MRSYGVLSDHDFERLVADLLGAELGVPFEVFARGPDGGVDLRHVRDDGTADVVQCKHMSGSTYPQLAAAARAEAAVVAAMSPAPATYRFVTTQPLTPARKGELAGILGLDRDDHVLGADDVDGLLTRHPRVERAHVKLWLSTTAQLNPATWVRSRALVAEIEEALPRYVETAAFHLARERLHAERVLVLSGPPGIGKTTLARMLLADATRDGYEPIEVSASIDEAYAVLDTGTRQVFYYDDFLGSAFLQHRLTRNEDVRLVRFIKLCAESETTLFVLTTREHILAKALQWYEELGRAGIESRRLLLAVAGYTPEERAAIFHNHVWHADLPAEAKEAVVAPAVVDAVVRHPNYNPRLIEHLTGRGAYRLSADDLRNYPHFVLRMLHDPDVIWRLAFEEQLDDDARDVLVALVSCGGWVAVDDVRDAASAWVAARGRVLGSSFPAVVKVLDDSFCRSAPSGGTVLLHPASPAVEDFVGKWLASNPPLVRDLLGSAVFFDQVEWAWLYALDVGEDGALARDVFVAGRRTWDSRSVTWQPRPGDARPSAPAYLPPSRDPMARLGLVARFLDRDDAEARDWVVGLIWRTRQEWAELAPWSIVDALPDVADLLPDGVAPLIAQVLAGDARRGYGWVYLGELCDETPEVFPDEVWDDVRKRFERWARRRLKRPVNETAYVNIWTTAGELGVDLGEDLRRHRPAHRR